jgi:hypothetical protein
VERRNPTLITQYTEESTKGASESTKEIKGKLKERLFIAG